MLRFWVHFQFHRFWASRQSSTYCTPLLQILWILQPKTEINRRFLDQVGNIMNSLGRDKSQWPCCIVITFKVYSQKVPGSADPCQVRALCDRAGMATMGSLPPSSLVPLSHAQTAVSLGDKTDQDRQTAWQRDGWTAHFLTVSSAFAILDSKNLTARSCANNRKR